LDPFHCAFQNTKTLSALKAHSDETLIKAIAAGDRALAIGWTTSALAFPMDASTRQDWRSLERETPE
jgi:hypothetical protein